MKEPKPNATLQKREPTPEKSYHRGPILSEKRNILHNTTRKPTEVLLTQDKLLYLSCWKPRILSCLNLCSALCRMWNKRQPGAKKFQKENHMYRTEVFATEPNRRGMRAGFLKGLVLFAVLLTVVVSVKNPRNDLQLSAAYTPTPAVTAKALRWPSKTNC